MKPNHNFILWGSAGHSKVLADIISGSGGSVVALFDNAPEALPSLSDVPLFIGKEGFEDWRRGYKGPLPAAGVAIGGGRGADRLDLIHWLRAEGLSLPPIIHPQACLSPQASIGGASQVFATAVVAAGARLGEGVIVNHGAVVDHESVLGPGCHVAPGAVLCGCVHLETNVFVGAGASILPRIRVGANSVIGAGAVVTRDLPPNSVAYGTPARNRNHSS